MSKQVIVALLCVSVVGSRFALRAADPDRIGLADLISLSVAHSPELSSDFRVDSHGNLNLPLLKGPLMASGLTEVELRDEIAAALRDQHLLVEPLVTVQIAESVSRRILVSGAVQKPGTFAASGLGLLQALNQAGGLSAEAGETILIQQNDAVTQRIPVRDLYSGTRQLDIPVEPGMQIFVPAVGKIFVLGDVRNPGAYPMNSGQDTTVLLVFGLCGGFGKHPHSKATIYRNVPATPIETQVQVPLRAILERKAPDVKLAAGDILYIPRG